MSTPDISSELEADWEDDGEKNIKKHSLDSDEDDDDDIEEKTYDIMAEDDIEGQEDGIAGFDGEVRFTPFNMKEELEEGHFDTDGNYHWKKEGKVVRDSWLDNIDWVKIKKDDNPTVVSSSDSEDSNTTSFDQIPVYKKMLAFMKPGETVAKSLRRLGGKKTMSASERWRRKKAGLADDSTSSQEVTDLTAMANQLLSETGNMDIYQESFEQISALVEAADMKGKKGLSLKRPATSYDDALDMYADDFDEKEKARLDTKKQKIDLEETQGLNPPPSLEISGPSTVIDSQERMDTEIKEKSDSDNKETVDTRKENTNCDTNVSLEHANRGRETTWEFKWKKDSTEVQGPHSTLQMQTWAEEDYFKGEVWVRRCGEEGPFYSSRRIDFDLYL